MQQRCLKVRTAMVGLIASLTLLATQPAFASNIAERVLVVDALADLRVKVVDHLPDERWRVRTGCIGQADIRVKRVRAFEDLRVKFVDAFPDRVVCVLRQSPPLRPPATD